MSANVSKRNQRWAGDRAARLIARFGVPLRLIVLGLAGVGLLGTPLVALAAGPNAVLTPTGYNANLVARGDDTSNLVVNMPFAMNWNGTNFTQIYINMNGNCTFGASYNGYNPNTSLAATNRNIMAPFWADVDTRNTATNQVTYSNTTAGSIPQFNGHDAFFVNWIGVGSYNNQASPTNSFQLVIVDRSDTGAGNFDFMFNYDQITWDIATAASTSRARVGWGRAGTGSELTGSGTAPGSPSALLDTADPATSLIQNSFNSGGQLGRYVFEVRSGVVPNTPPTITATDRVLEGNVVNGYTGYTGAGDVTASDPDGSIASLTSDLPPLLPLGTTTVTWTATDNSGASVSTTQSVTVTDTTPPINPPLSSPSHVTGAWSGDPTVTVDASLGATDVCTGVLGFSYGWNRDAAGIPDTVTDTATVTTRTTTTTTTVDSQSFDTATWPAADGWVRSDNTYVRLTNTAGRNHGTYAAEIWANNNTNRRTVNFYRDYDLTGFTSATLDFWDQVSALSSGQDYARVEYSTNGGTSWMPALRETVGGSTAQAWAARSYSLPVGGTVRVRFSGSVNRTTEYADWDDISVTGYTTTTLTGLTASSTSELPDGTWYFSLSAVDNAGNWSAPASIGPYLIDTVPPVTTDDAPAGWSTSPVNVTLTPSDAGVIDYTRYSLNGSAFATYVGAVGVSAEGTSTLRYFSADAAGRVETTKTTTVRVDTQAPTVPSALLASAVSTSQVELVWSGSTDGVSGMGHYAVYRDGAVVATTTATTFTVGGLTPGTTYDFEVSALDVAGNESARSASASESVPSASLWVSVSSDEVDMGSIDPGSTATVTDATVITVGGIGTQPYELLCSAQDFINADPLATMPTLPSSALSFVGRGFATIPAQPFSASLISLDTAPGSKYRWSHDYIFDYTFDVPWTFEAGDYSTTVVYTVVPD